MQISELLFDENKEMYFVFDESGNAINLIIADSLFAYDEELSELYKQKILDFINQLPQWYSKAVETVCAYGCKRYQNTSIIPQKEDVRLNNIFILFEQKSEPMFGLQFRTEYDVEHGCGLQINVTDFEVVKIGGADVAFCR